MPPPLTSETVSVIVALENPLLTDGEIKNALPLYQRERIELQEEHQAA